VADARLTSGVLRGFGAGVLLIACASQSSGPARPSSAARAPSIDPGASFSDRDWDKLVSSRFFVALPLPDARQWRVDDTSGRWLAAAHLPSKSMLWVRAWREGSVVNHAACEAAARSYRPDLLGHDESALVDRRPLDVPEGFDTEVGFSVSRNKGALGAVAAAFGAHVRQCLVMIYATRADGPDAEQVVADRVGFIVDRVFARVESRKIDDRIVPQVRGR
jgi:hypothetical protein